MTRLAPLFAAALALVACAGQQTPPASSPTAALAEPVDPVAAAAEPSAVDEAAAAAAEAEAEAQAREAEGDLHEFKENTSGKPGLAQGIKPSAIEPTRTEAALKFTVVDKDKGPIEGLVIKLTDPKGQSYFTDETDAKGYTEVLVPVGQEYEAVYLSLGRKTIAARLPVSNESRQTIRLTLRYKRYDEVDNKTVRQVLEGVEFDSGKATLRPESYPKLARVVEYLRYKKSARIEIAGHTDNVGNPARNKALSLRRARACRQHLISQGIAPDRIKAVGYGQERPLDDNDTATGRQRNRRIEASEL